jgi:DNA-binding transcriptional MerR regulator
MIVYELSDIARLLGIDKSRVKNWTIGRPFTIKPSVRSASGKGSRNLFCWNDLYVFALVESLNDVGAPVQAIQGLLQEHDLSGDCFWKDENWVLIKRIGNDYKYALNLHEDYSDRFELDPEQRVICFYAVNVKSIKESVYNRVNSFSKQAVAARREVARVRKATAKERKQLTEALKRARQGRDKKAV